MSGVTRRALMFGATAGLLMRAGPCGAQGTQTSPETSATDLRFDVIRNGTRIGSHYVVFRPAGDRIAAITQIRISVRMAGLEVFRFRHDCEEVWRGGRVFSLRASTDDNGEYFDVHGAAQSDHFVMSGPLGVEWLRGNMLTSNTVWSPEFVQQSAVIDAQRGGALPVRCRDEGRERVRVGAGERDAARYGVWTPRLTGSVWYDASGRWVQGVFITRGETAEYRLV